MASILYWVIPVVTLILGIFIGKHGFICDTCNLRSKLDEEENRKLMTEASELKQGFKD